MLFIRVLYQRPHLPTAQARKKSVSLTSVWKEAVHLWSSRMSCLLIQFLRYFWGWLAAAFLGQQWGGRWNKANIMGIQIMRRFLLHQRILSSGENILVSFKVWIHVPAAGGTVEESRGSNSITRCHGDREVDKCNADLRKTSLSGLSTEVVCS